jgi:hypothetical protein
MHILGAVEHESSRLSPRPCKHFDLICGVGSGGLVAILLGCLEMRCDEAMRAYVRLGQLAFEEQMLGGKAVVLPRGRDRPGFRAELEQLTAKHCGNKDGVMESVPKSSNACRVSTTD